MTQFHGDGQFYRAKVIDVTVDEYDNSKTELELNFVDYGDHGLKPKDVVFDIRTEFLKLSFQAIPCSMSNIKPR